MQNAPLGAFCNTFDLHKAIIGLEIFGHFESGRFTQIFLHFEKQFGTNSPQVTLYQNCSNYTESGRFYTGFTVLCILETPKLVIWQTMKTQPKCHKMWNFLGSALFAKTKTFLHSGNGFLRFYPGIENFYLTHAILPRTSSNVVM